MVRTRKGEWNEIFVEEGVDLEIWIKYRFWNGYDYLLDALYHPRYSNLIIQIQFSEKYKDFGASLEFVTNKPQEGSQFVKGFGGIGGILRYKVDFNQMSFDSEDEFLSDKD
ncbi:Polypeptide release factor (eRF1) in translation termination [Nowakowskiella sp. JEL0407]|nr:Polypeptide release factor (eRF1) in translation termination [Nowakowskiella sp. JEL0407]